ncbi:MFS transporter [Phenylobacterium sp. LjRoot219]|uniref:MFS transporter n=1 Tax=Phenylobacterium sp. LjRoot219 TaxID=3342283 RepID=UPI003ECCF660
MGRVYYGWCIVAIAVLANMLVVGSTYSAFGLFVLPVSAEYQLSRANMNTALILLNLAAAVVAPLLGRLLDRFPAKRIMMVCAVLLALSFTVLGLSRSLWLSAAFMTLPLAAGINGAAGLTMNVLVARWFVAQRGRAMALSVLGLSLGSVVVTPLVGFLIETQGWRTALLMMGAAHGLLLMLLATFVRERPGPGEVESGGAPRPTTSAAAAQAPAAAPARPLAVGAILRMPQFWSIALSAAMAMGMAQALTVSVVPLALDEGLTMLQATSLVSMIGVSALVSKLLLAVVADKLDRVVLLSGLFGLGTVLNAALLASEGYATLVATSLLMGVTIGTLAPLVYTLLADRFGATSFGTVRGLSAPISSLMGAACVRFAGEVFDRTGGYDLMFGSFIAAQVLAALLMLSTRFLKPAATTMSPAATSA